MVLEFFRALLLAGLPVGLTSYFLFSWALRRRPPGSVTSLKALQRELKLQSKERAKERAKQKKENKRDLAAVFAEGAHFSRDSQLDLIHNKWLTFGGGFYGVVGLLTYAVVEFSELWDFAMGFENIWALIAQFGLDTLINLLVEALRNFIVAIAWPAYWMSEIQTGRIWLWLVVAYAGYWAGARLALRRFSLWPSTRPEED
jgi:hypothetical protein